MFAPSELGAARKEPSAAFLQKPQAPPAHPFGAGAEAGSEAVHSPVQAAVGTLQHQLGLGGAHATASAEKKSQVARGAEEAASVAQGRTGADAVAAAEAGALAGAAKESSGGTLQRLAPALDAAAHGESLPEQARRLSGPVTMNGADAVRVRSALWRANDGGGGGGGGGSGGGEQAADPQRAAIQQACSGGQYQSPFVSVALSGIRNVESDARNIDQSITGDQNAEGVAAYAPSPSIPHVPAAVNSGIDAINDVAAVTQYAAAADLAVRIDRNPNGGGQVAVDWAALSQMQVSADLNALGQHQQISYQSPAQVAQSGADAVRAAMQAEGRNPDDKSQLVSLTGHSGGGQSSFYTALKLASDGYTNISLVGVDMAMTPHQREVLESLGVKVTNITSNNGGTE